MRGESHGRRRWRRLAAPLPSLRRTRTAGPPAARTPSSSLLSRHSGPRGRVQDGRLCGDGRRLPPLPLPAARRCRGRLPPLPQRRWAGHPCASPFLGRPPVAACARVWVPSRRGGCYSTGRWRALINTSPAERARQRDPLTELRVSTVPATGAAPWLESSPPTSSPHCPPPSNPPPPFTLCSSPRSTPDTLTV